MPSGIVPSEFAAAYSSGHGPQPLGLALIIALPKFHGSAFRG